MVVAHRAADVDGKLRRTAGVGSDRRAVWEGYLGIVLALGEGDFRAFDGIALPFAALKPRDHGALDFHP